MRIGLAGLLLLVAFTTALSQDALENTWVTLQARRMPLPQAFRIIQKKTGLLFVYQPGLVDIYTDVLMPEGRMTVDAALDSLLRGTYLGFSESNRNIIVFKVPQLKNVTGYIKDFATGETLPEAHLGIKDTDRVTKTDASGYYEIEALDDDIIIVSYVGMVPVEVKVDGKTKVDILMHPVVLETVTVNGGYYQVKHREQTGNISSTSRATIRRQPVTNPLQAIQTSTPGVFIQQLSGLPGSGITIAIQGQNSLNEDANKPLFLVDGIPYPASSISSVLAAGQIIPNSSSMSGVAPALIESVDVLKGADATAIYGARGANGVVLVTTRQATPGFGIEVNVNYGVSQVANFVRLLDNRQWVEMRHEAFKNDKVLANPTNAPDLLLWDTTRNTNWQRKLIGNTGHFTDATVSVHGGNDDLRVFGAYNINKQTNVFPGTFGYTRGSGLVNIQATPLNKKVKFLGSVNYSVEENVLPTIDLTKEAVTLAPVAPSIYTAEDDLNWENGTWVNPYSHLRNMLKVDANYFLASSQIEYSILQALRVKLNAGFTNIERSEINLNKISSQNPVTTTPLTGTQIRSNVSSSTWIAEPQLEYKNDFDWGKVSMLIGLTFQRTKEKGQTLVGYGYISDATIESIPAAPQIESYEPTDIENSYSSFFSRLSYNYRSRYLLSLTARRDASSRFAPGVIANFGAVGAAWIFTNESFAKHWEFLEFGKIRMSYGTVGNDQIKDYGFMATFATTDLTYAGQSGIYPNRLSNTKYSWELSRKFEAGMLLGIFKNHVLFDLSYYRNVSTNQLLARSLATTTGFETVQYNLPVEVRNTGLELSVDAQILASDRCIWTSKINMTYPKNKLVRYDKIEESSDSRKYVVGESINILKRYRYLGIDQETGDFLYNDKNNDAKYDNSDLQATKTNGPNWYGGLENTFTYKCFELSVMLQYVSQVKETLMKQLSVPGTNRTNQPVEVMNRWSNKGDIAEGHRFTQTVTGLREYSIGQALGENGYANADYFRIKNVSLSYTLPAKFTQRVALRSASIYIMSQNTFTITKYPGFDPENANVNVLPPIRTITIGAQIKL